jgi:hypothetical protein
VAIPVTVENFCKLTASAARVDEYTGDANRAKGSKLPERPYVLGNDIVERECGVAVFDEGSR